MVFNYFLDARSGHGYTNPIVHISRRSILESSVVLRSNVRFLRRDSGITKRTPSKSLQLYESRQYGASLIVVVLGLVLRNSGSRSISVNMAPSLKYVGYIGLGNAGFSMASNVPKAGYHLVVHDADQSKVERAAKEWKNTTASGGQAEAFSECEVIVTMLPQGKIVREVLFGNKGIAKGLKAGTIIVDTSSSSPFDTRALGKELAEHDLQLIDAPITQTYMHATDAGESTLMVGSDSEEAFEKVRPILQCMARYIFHMGGLGTGHAMKTLNNYIMASSLVALSDSLVTGQKFGLDPQKMIDVLNVGTG